MWFIPRIFYDLLNVMLALKASLDLNTQYIARLIDVIKRPPDPGPIHLLVTGENQMALQFKIVLPATPDPIGDTKSGELTLTVAGGAPTVIPTTLDQTEVVGLSGNDNDTVEASFVFIDDAGNKSTKPSAISETLRDTIPPPDAGALGLVVTGET